MFFKEKNCKNCNNSYDQMVDFCPFCKSENLDNKEAKENNQMMWLSLKDQIINFIIGFLGLNFITIIISIIFANIINKDQLLGLMIVTSVSYALTLVALIIYNFANKTLQYFKKYFLDKDAYFYGIFFAAILIGLSILFSYIAQSVFPNQTSGNQTSAESIAVKYPVAGIIILGFVGPIVEELAYRVGLFNFLCRIKIWVAYLIEAIFFALLHFDFTGNLLLELVNLPSYLLAGILLSYVYQKKGPAASMTAHIINNVTSVLVIIIESRL